MHDLWRDSRFAVGVVEKVAGERSGIGGRTRRRMLAMAGIRIKIK